MLPTALNQHGEFITVT